MQVQKKDVKYYVTFLKFFERSLKGQSHEKEYEFLT
jgi:hypothetical protein